jgi:hypothetical protein
VDTDSLNPVPALNANPDKDPKPDPIRIQGFDVQKLKKKKYR